MPDWNRAFRNDWTEPERLPEDQRNQIAACDVQPSSCGFKTWKDVYLNGQFIGMVRVKIGGISEFKRTLSSEPGYAGDATKLNSLDNTYSLSILALLEIIHAGDVVSET